MKEPLFRIISLESFISLCISGKERFVNPIDIWDDTYEGYMLRGLDSEIGIEKTINQVYQKFDCNVESTIDNLSKLLRARYSCFAQSWSTLPDSDAMWRIYSYNNHGIQICTNENQIRNMIESNNIDGGIIRIRPVIYDDSITRIDDLIYSGSNIDEAYFHKRKAFEHECETRVILQLTKDYLDYTSFANSIIKHNYRRNKTKTTEIRKISNAVQKTMGNDLSGMYKFFFHSDLHLNIPSVSDYICTVKVHPLAEKWYEDLIKEICLKYNIQFAGKSNLYNKSW